MEGFIAALLQEWLELGALGDLGGELASQLRGGRDEGAAGAAAGVGGGGVGEQPRGEADSRGAGR